MGFVRVLLGMLGWSRGGPSIAKPCANDAELKLPGSDWHACQGRSRNGDYQRLHIVKIRAHVVFIVPILMGSLVLLPGCSQRPALSGAEGAPTAASDGGRPASNRPMREPAFNVRGGASAAAVAADFTFEFRQYTRQPKGSHVPVIYEAVGGGDFDGDRRRDIVAFQNDNQIELLLQREDGTFSSEVFSSGSATYTAWQQFVVADFNNDRIDDIAFNVVDDHGSQGGVSMLLSRKGMAPTLRSVSPTGLVTSGSEPANWVALDVNSDGNMDLVAYHNSLDDFTYTYPSCETGFCPHYNVQYGDGNGGLAPPKKFDVDTTENIKEVVAEDVDWDGSDDLVFVGVGAPEAPGSVAYARKLPSGGFAGLVELHKTVTSDFLYFADINGDARRDTIKGAEIHLRQADGSFGQTLWLFTYYSTAIQPVFGDFDGDGLTDLVNHQFEDFFTIPFFALYLQRGATLQAPVRFNDPPMDWSLDIDPFGRNVYAVGDFNGDRCRDIAVAANYDGIVFLDGKNCIPIPLIRTGGGLPPTLVRP